MSHITNVKTEFKSLDYLEDAAKQLGGVLNRDAKKFVTFGGKLAKCEHSITFPNAQYGIGIVKSKDGETYSLKLDYWSSGGLLPVVGQNCNKLRQEYTIAGATAQAERKGFRVVREKQNDGTVRLFARS